MRDITPETPRKDIVVGGLIFKAPTPFAEGDVLNANEAAALNQTYLENVGNNFRGKVDTFRRKLIAGADASAEVLKAVTKEQLSQLDEDIEAGKVTIPASAVAELQAVLDGIVAEYRMNVRRSSSVEPIDPIEREARSLARDIIRAHLRSKGIKLNTVGKEKMDAFVDKVLSEDSPRAKKIRADAKKRVALAQQTAAEELGDLDLELTASVA